MNYAQAIKKAHAYAADNPPQVDNLSMEDLHDAVEAISTLLKGSGVGAVDRLILNEERKAFRAEIARRQP